MGRGGGTLYATTRYDGEITAWTAAGAGLGLSASSSHVSGASAGSLPGLAFVGTAVLTGGSGRSTFVFDAGVVTRFATLPGGDTILAPGGGHVLQIDAFSDLSALAGLIDIS